MCLASSSVLLLILDVKIGLFQFIKESFGKVDDFRCRWTWPRKTETDSHEKNVVAVKV
jgi:hypothetical protein